MIARLPAIILALSVTACASAPVSEPSTSEGARRRPLSDAETCAFIVEVARQVDSEAIDPVIPRDGQSALDCETAMREAGIEVARQESGTQRRLVLSAPVFTDDTVAVVEANFLCLALCGHGERLTLTLRDGQWIIIDRKTTWIS